MKKYQEFMEQYRAVTKQCRDIGADMASFYLVLSGLDELVNEGQRQYLDDKMTLVRASCLKLSAELERIKQQQQRNFSGL